MQVFLQSLSFGGGGPGVAWGTVLRAGAEVAVSLIPVVGTVYDGYQLYQDIRTGSYYAATADGVLLAVSLLPGAKIVAQAGMEALETAVVAFKKGEKIAVGEAVQVGEATTAGVLKASKYHKKMVDEVVADLKAEGYVVKKEATFREACGSARCRPDIIYQDAEGKLHIIEVKTGNGGLSKNQTSIFPEIISGEAYPRGKWIEEFKMNPNLPLKNQGYPSGIPIEIRQFPGE